MQCERQLRLLATNRGRFYHGWGGCCCCRNDSCKEGGHWSRSLSLWQQGSCVIQTNCLDTNNTCLEYISKNTHKQDMWTSRILSFWGQLKQDPYIGPHEFTIVLRDQKASSIIDTTSMYGVDGSLNQLRSNLTIEILTQDTRNWMHMEYWECKNLAYFSRGLVMQFWQD